MQKNKNNISCIFVKETPTRQGILKNDQKRTTVVKEIQHSQQIPISRENGNQCGHKRAFLIRWRNFSTVIAGTSALNRVMVTRVSFIKLLRCFLRHTENLRVKDATLGTKIIVV